MEVDKDGAMAATGSSWYLKKRRGKTEKPGEEDRKKKIEKKYGE
ncbi:hypothetical protein NO371_17160 [Escherichia coli]|nr:hypothetical protein [Escherichia coli]